MKNYKFSSSAKSIWAIAILTASALLTSCSKNEDGQQFLPSSEDQALLTLQQTLPETLVIFNPDEFYPDGTKSSDSGPVDVASSSLDYGAASFLSDDRYDYIQIPINTRSPFSAAYVSLPGYKDGGRGSVTATGKTYLVSQTSKDTARTTTVNIITIVPHPDFMKDGELDSLDFFYNGYFNAVIFYSDTEGRLLRSEVYAHGILAGDGITGTPGQGDSVLAAVIPEVLTPTSVSTLQNGITTRPNDWTETLNPIYVVASPPGNDDDTWISDDPDHPSNRRGQPEETKDYVIKPVGGGGTPNEITYRVNISIIGRGTATGAGTYNPMDIVTCTASPLSIGGTVTSSFVFWSGYVSSTEPTVTFLIMGDFLNRELKLSAVFHNLSPCADGGRTDPLMEMQIRGSGYKGSNIKEAGSGIM